MNVTKREMKDEAVNRMKILKLSDKVIKEFCETGEVYLSINGSLFPADEKHKDKIRKFEDKTNSLVYHMIWNTTNLGDFLTLLYVSKYSEEWKYDIKDLKKGFPLAYVINEDHEMFSEFGSVGVESSNGALIRNA